MKQFDTILQTIGEFRNIRETRLSSQSRHPYSRSEREGSMILLHACFSTRIAACGLTTATGITQMLVIPSDQSPDRSLDRRLDRPLDRVEGERGGSLDVMGIRYQSHVRRCFLGNVHRMFIHRHTLVSKLIPRRRETLRMRNGIAASGSERNGGSFLLSYIRYSSHTYIEK